MIFSGLILERVCPAPFAAFYFPSTSSWVCWSNQAYSGVVAWDKFPADDYPSATADVGQAGMGVAAILFFLWGYALCLSVANKFEQRPRQEDVPSPQG